MNDKIEAESRTSQCYALHVLKLTSSSYFIFTAIWISDKEKRKKAYMKKKAIQYDNSPERFAKRKNREKRKDREREQRSTLFS
jgi:hypothetical protein